MRTVFTTHVSDDWFEPVGAKKLITSANFFHPEIPFITFKSKEIQEKFKNPLIYWDTLIAPLCADLTKDYDLIVHFDADSCITSTLDEILKADYDIAGVRNNNDFGKAGKLPYRLEPSGTDPFKYINAGLVASTKAEFWHEWVALNHEKAHYCPMAENDTLNEIFHNGKYNSKILDPKESNVYYGTATQYGTHSHWDSWKCIKYENNGLYLNNKKVKVLHHAGGHTLPKLTLNMFTPKVQNYIKYVADPPTLIDSKGNTLILQNEKFIKMNMEFTNKLNIINKNNLTILHTNANVGLYSLYTACRAKKIYAMEVTKEYNDVMLDLIKINNIKNIEINTYQNQEVDLIIEENYPDVKFKWNSSSVIT